jgi:hypothetical protein
MKDYQEVNGTFYDATTNKDVINVLENARANNTRIILDYGDVKTGKSWNEIFDVTGRIGRSTGSIKIPLLIHNRRSMGGGAILDNCIIGIKESKGKRVLYQMKN